MPSSHRSEIKELVGLHRQALDTASEYFNIIIEFINDERVPQHVRRQYLYKLAGEFTKGIEE